VLLHERLSVSSLIKFELAVLTATRTLWHVLYYTCLRHENWEGSLQIHFFLIGL